MNRIVIVLSFAVLLACGTAVGGQVYNVDVQNSSSLGAIPQTDVTPTPGGPFDAGTVAAGDAVWIVNSGGSAKTLSGNGITVAGGGAWRLGLTSSNATTAEGITINLYDGLDYRDFVIGDTSGTAALVSIGHDNLDKAVSVVGRALNIVDGTVTINSGTSGTASLQFAQMTLSKGALVMAGSGAKLTISGAAVVGHGTDSADTATLTVVNNGANFSGGLTVQRGGILNNSSTGAVLVNFNSSSTATLTLAGGTIQSNAANLRLSTTNITVSKVEGATSTLDATGGQISFATGAGMKVAGNLDVLGADTAIALKSYAQTGGDVVIAGSAGLAVTDKATIASGTFQAANTTFTGGADVSNGARLLHGNLTLGSGSALRVGSSSYLDLSKGNLTMTGDAGIEIYGTMIVGEAAGTANRLTATDSGVVVTFASTSKIELSEDFVNKLDSSYLGQKIVDIGTGGSIVLANGASSQVSDSFLYGSYTFELDADRDLALTGYGTVVSRDGTQADYEKARDMIYDRYGPLVKDADGFALNIYKSAVREDASAPVVPYDRLQASAEALIAGSSAQRSYNMNMANFQAFARGNGDMSLAGLYSGLSNAGVVDAAMSTAVNVVDHVKMRLRNVGVAQAEQAAAVGSSEAVGSIILDSELANRLWVGGFGLYEDADSRYGIPGYRYAPAGFIGGYDYSADCFTIGGVYAYAKGSFADKSSLAHDSELASHSFGLHGSYYHPSGAFASVMGGYTYSSNDISELRTNPSISSSSWHTAEYNTHTWHGALEIGYEYRANDRVTITPTIGFTYVSSESNNHDELLGGVLAGRVRGVRNHATYVPANVEVGYEVLTGAESRIRFTANGGYAYNFTDDPVEGTFTPFGFANAFSHNVVGRDGGHHLLNVGTGMHFVTDRFDVGLQYDFYYKSHYAAHRLMATAGFSF